MKGWKTDSIVSPEVWFYLWDKERVTYLEIWDSIPNHLKKGLVLKSNVLCYDVLDGIYKVKGKYYEVMYLGQDEDYEMGTIFDTIEEVIEEVLFVLGFGYQEKTLKVEFGTKRKTQEDVNPRMRKRRKIKV